MKKYLVRYYNNGWFGTHIHANSHAEAEAICKRHSMQLDGEHKFSLGGPLGAFVSKLFGKQGGAE